MPEAKSRAPYLNISVEKEPPPVGAEGVLMVREAGLELTYVGSPSSLLIPKSIASKGLATLFGVRQYRSELSDFIPVRLKIWLNFVAARNVPVTLA